MPSIPTTTALSLPIAPLRQARPLRVVAFALAVFVLEVALAHGVVGPQISRYIFLFLGLFVVAAIFRFQLATALVYLGLTDFLFYPQYFAYQLGSLTIHPHEVALGVLLLIAIVRPKRRTWGGLAGLALALFLAMVAISTLIALQSGRVGLTEGFNWARPLFSLTFFYVIVRLFPSSAARRTLLLGSAVLAAATGLVALAIAAGAGFGAALQSGSVEIVRHEPGVGSLERVRLPGLSASYALFWWVAVQAIERLGPRRLLWGALLAGITLDVAVSFNRNMWLGLIIGLALMATLGGTVVRGRIAMSIAVIAVIAGLFLVFDGGSSSEKVAQPLVERGETLFNPGKTSQESSLQDRAKESEKAWATFKQYPLFGVGAGASFGVNIVKPIFSGPIYLGNRPEPQLFLHNQYLYLLLISGIPGLLAFIVFLGKPIMLACGRRPSDPSIIALAVGIALIMISSFVAIYFTVDDMTAVLGLLTGVIVADAEGRGADRRPSGLLAGASGSG